MASENKKKKSPFRRNLLVAFILAVVLLLLYVSVPGYNWAITEMAFKNKELMDKVETRRLNYNLPELTMDDKRYFKIANYWYLDYLKKQCPQDAVVLLPPQSAVDTSEEMNLISNSEWVSYFLFPRLCISLDEKNAKPALFAKVTHVAIVRGWGYDQLPYTPTNIVGEAVFPIDSTKYKRP